MAHRGLHDARLLTIDDSALIHQLLKSHLRGENLELHSATTGEEGVRMARALVPDAILLDLSLEDMTGFEVLAELKTDQGTQHIPVLFLSGSCSTEDRVRGLDLGAVDFITKPFEISELKARVRSAVRTTRLIKLLAHRAQIDGLTGLWNRTYFDERLEQEVAEALRYGNNTAMILCDIDHFKAVNDRYSHPFGDHVLERFARTLTENRMTDICCRYGGEEFALILPQTDAAGAAALAERLRSTMELHRWDGHKDLIITVSFGVCDLHIAPETTSRALVACADRALYAAKAAGRNRVCVDSGHMIEPSRAAA